MCFFVNGPAEIAKEDIPCKKIMQICDGVLNSFYYPSADGYELGDTIYGLGAINGHPRRHACSLNKRVVLSKEVVHSYISNDAMVTDKKDFLNRIYPHKKAIVVECIIPKGTWYWKDSQSHECVSFKVKLLKIIE